jgi:hypothetical protein
MPNDVMTTSPDQAAASDLAPSDLDSDHQTLLNPPVQWSPDLVEAIHKAVHEETVRTAVGARWLLHPVLIPKRHPYDPTRLRS